MQILLIRHGQSEADLLNVHEGSADYPLTEEGIDQVNRMAKRVLKEFPPDFIWASTQKRARKTADILADLIGCPITYLTELREHDNGDLAGQPLDEVPFPWGLHPHEKFGLTGESAIEFRARGEQAFSYMKKNSTEYKRIAIVSHGGMISRIIESFLGLPCNHDIFFKTDDTGIHLLEYKETGRSILFSNSSTHL
ncbi:histidine phosphatase family protein [Radiobacillus kanasensis]|uniref:histidine phosphatase family protein n=1 Tax=Radiobacillus kanasensis TaxID=2844358 RepID=UPI001E600D08|nr:histidine phosphatase family protein [Radiobacillus kanasensis]UFT99609.1 histidine phosphatase family protein [Radiobacillus kanasensis]